MSSGNTEPDRGYGKNWDPSGHYLPEEVAAGYDRQRFSGPAGRFFNLLEQKLIRRCFDDLPRDCSIVDIPCGTGRLAEVLLDMGFKVAGLDISEAMLNVAKQRLQRFGERFQPSVVDARTLRTSGLGFDAALCARVLMHFPLVEQIEFLGNVASVVQRRVVFTHGLDTRYHRLRRGVKRLLRNQAGAVYPISPADLEKLIADAGLRKIRQQALLPLLSEAVVEVCEPAGRTPRS